MIPVDQTFAVVICYGAAALNVACCFYYRKKLIDANRTADTFFIRLNALRHNAYLRTEKGHLRRYAECSDVVQARAEG